ncbi:hypothetical protein [Indiicoccus explosivorum]|uniref:hypothetical protein n=1 Tax=Indiicoccus explosivorum TaxID=1917864 RepID=UPI001F4DC021|nr:hypothetical protein [Indiicoccus explosivorum]
MDDLKMTAACLHAGLDPASASYLGEGAWHDAWCLVHEGEAFVLRIPKEEAYGRKIEYDEAALNAEYGGTALYYGTVNQAVPGAAPAFFKYYISSDLCYTIETFAGTALDLHSLNSEKARAIGYAIGEIYRKTEEVPVELTGLGYLAWSAERGLHGEFDFDFRQFMEEECNEFKGDYEALCSRESGWSDPKVETALETAIQTRKRAFTSLKMTNQDASPENILLHHGEVRLIDPYPIIYHGAVMAGNFMNLYEMLFAALAETERYRKHRFGECRETLQAIAHGFLQGYCENSIQKIQEVRGEQFLQVLQTAVAHWQMLEKGVAESEKVRYGSREMILARLVQLQAELKRLAAFL